MIAFKTTLKFWSEVVFLQDIEELTSITIQKLIRLTSIVQ